MPRSAISNIFFSLQIGTANGVIFQSVDSSPLQTISSEFRQITISNTVNETTQPTNIMLQVQTANSTRF